MIIESTAAIPLSVSALYALLGASFDGVSSSVTTSGTFVFEIKQKDVIRVWIHVPLDAAFSVSPDLDAIMRVQELPG